MSSAIFRLDPVQFPRQEFDISLREYAANKVQRRFVLYVRNEGGPLTAERKRKGAIASLRDALKLPERSVVEEREKVLNAISEGIKHYRTHFSYRLDAALENRIFSKGRYRDVKVSDLAALNEDIREKVGRKPNIFGREAFSTEQWNNIIQVTEAALSQIEQDSFIHTPSRIGQWGFAERRSMRSCISLFQKIWKSAWHVIKKTPVAIVAGILFGGVTLLFPPVGMPMVAGAVGGAALYAYLTSPASKMSEAEQIKKLSAELVKGWDAEFKRKRDPSLAPRWNLFLASGSAWFSSDIRLDLLSRGYSVNEKILSRAIAKAFDELSAKHADIRSVKSNGKTEYLTIGEVQYTSINSYHGVNNQVITSFKADNRDNIILRRLNQRPLEDYEMHLLNREVLAKTALLGEPPLNQSFKGRSLTGFLGLRQLKDGYIGQVFEDYRNWLTMDEVDAILTAAIDSRSSDEKKSKEQEWVQNIARLLLSDALEVRNSLGDTAVPAGVPAVDSHGYLRWNIEQWLDDTHAPTNEHASEEEPRVIVHSDRRPTIQNGSFDMDDDVFVTGSKRIPHEARVGKTGVLVDLMTLDSSPIGELAGENVSTQELRLTRSEKEIREHFAKRIKEYRKGKLKLEKEQSSGQGEHKLPEIAVNQSDRISSGSSGYGSAEVKHKSRTKKIGRAIGSKLALGLETIGKAGTFAAR